MYLYGAGGHSKVIIDILRDQNIELKALVDDNPAITESCGYPVLHDATGLTPMIVTVGNCAIRRRIVEKLNCEFGTIKHSSAIVSPSATIGEGTMVMQGAIIQAGASVGRHCIINTKCSVDHDCQIDDYVHIAPGCTLSGDVHVGEGTWIGTGASVIQGIRIGRNCFIGAGSVVVKDIPDNTKAYGVPCRVIENI